MLDIVLNNIKEHLEKKIIAEQILVHFEFNKIKITIIQQGHTWYCVFNGIVPELQRGLPTPEIARQCTQKYEKYILNLYFKTDKCS